MSEEKKIAYVSEIYGDYVFDDRTMQARLPKRAYHKLKDNITNGKKLDFETAEVIAHEMKEWALEKGATHYTHWFQPLTGESAEKHETFMSAPQESGRVLMNFSGLELIEGESDASSFPSGGLRATFEARGYTVWDCTSPVFIKDDTIGKTLCIPTSFCSYSGEALDQKTPLLRSMEAIDVQMRRLLKLFGHDDVKRVIPSVGAEQEYFIIDREKFLKRKDLIYTGRTLIGAMPPKGQDLDDHYYGTIRQRIGAFMKDVDMELWKLGVPAKTEHNEVAPAQHELAPIFEQVNVATDHNQLTMEILKKVAYRHGLHCLLHEKPFAGVNGSGKHNNWSLTTDKGRNLLEPGKNPNENIEFLIILCGILKAVDEHAGLLIASVSSAGNDHRLGKNEAPPAIMSVYLGSQLEDILEQFRKKGEAASVILGEKLNTGVGTLPDFLKDASDRNRTSPFAFTGNKFEFRMLGSGKSIGSPNIILNTIVAESISDICDELEKSEDFDKTVNELIVRMVTDHERLIFNGNSYSKEWVIEAKKRGLTIVDNAVSALPYFISERTVNTFSKFNVFSKSELASRIEIEYEVYAKKINIEAKTMINIIRKSVIPAVIRYSNTLADSINSVKSAINIESSTQTALLQQVISLLDEANENLVALEKNVNESANISTAKDKAIFSRDYVVTAMDSLREPIDKLEMIVDKSIWPMPSYGDLLFEV